MMRQSSAMFFVALFCVPASAGPLDVVQNFDDPGTPYSIANPSFSDGGIIAGGPTGNYFRLVEGVAFGSHPFEIAFPRTAPGIYSTVRVDFDFRMTPVFGRADGMGFLWLPTSVYGMSGNSGGTADGGLEPTVPGSLAIVFDIFDNDASPNPPEPNNNHVQLNYDGNFVDVATPSFDLANAQWHHASFELASGDFGTMVSVVLTLSGGTPITLFDNRVIPGLNMFEGRPAFYATLGAEWAHHDIDNIEVRFANPVPEPTSFALWIGLAIPVWLRQVVLKKPKERRTSTC